MRAGTRLPRLVGGCSGTIRYVLNPLLICYICVLNPPLLYDTYLLNPHTHPYYKVTGFRSQGGGGVNDGYDDLMIGAMVVKHNVWADACAYVIYGKGSAFATVDMAKFTSGASGFIIHRSVSGAGAGGAGESGDGYDDVTVDGSYAVDNRSM
jgi:hypothetical protein